MNRKFFSVFVFLFVLFFNVAFSYGNYDFADARSDADTVRTYLHSSGSSAAASAFDRLYDFLYEDAHDYVINTNSGKFHNPSCSGVKKMNPSNRIDISCSRELLLCFGFDPCKTCKP